VYYVLRLEFLAFEILWTRSSKPVYKTIDRVTLFEFLLLYSGSDLDLEFSILSLSRCAETHFASKLYRFQYIIQALGRLAIRDVSPSFEPVAGHMPCPERDIQMASIFDIASTYPTLASST
jgi:hypothetical protein